MPYWRSVLGMSRESFSGSVTCPRCGKQGEYEASENDYPFMRTVGYRVDDLSAGFSLTKTGDTRSQTEISCDDCGIKVR